MIDPFGRHISYLRVSVTDRCDFRCVYCMSEHMTFLPKAELLTLEEMDRLCGAFIAKGVERMRITGGERIRLSDDVTVSVYPSLHSCVWTHRALPPVDEICIGDLGVIYQDRIERGQQQADYVLGLGSTVASHLSSGNQNARGDGGALVYLIEAPAGRLLFQDTCGHWSGIMSALRPDIALLAAAGRPNLDGEPFQGTLADYLVGLTGLIRPRQLILTHHDDWLPGFSSRIDTGIVRHEMAQAGLSTVLTDLPYWETVALHS